MLGKGKRGDIADWLVPVLIMLSIVAAVTFALTRIFGMW